MKSDGFRSSLNPNGLERTATRTRPLRHDVVDSLRDAIGNGALKPGQRILEQELAAELGVSRLPIREAIRQLEHEGLLVTIPNRGAFVATVTEQDIREMFSLREALECLAARLVAQRASPGEIDQLQALVAQMQETSARRDFAALFQIDTDFHTLLCTFSRHGRLLKHWHLVYGQWRALDSLMDEIPTLNALPDEHPIITALRRFADMHQTIVDAIRAGDAVRAEQAMRLHMAQAEQSTIDINTVGGASR